MARTITHKHTGTRRVGKQAGKDRSRSAFRSASVEDYDDFPSYVPSSRMRTFTR